MKLYWGDLHNHCDISYGYGSLENALRCAAVHLDFCCVTGHAMWPDMYDRNPETDFIVDFHERGFAKLKAHWLQVRQTINDANGRQGMVTFQSYEMHSSRYGDHHIVSPDGELPLIYRDSPAELVRDCGVRAIAVPHHIGYTPGYRGIDWEAFREQISPVVEICSKHGCAIREDDPTPYYHDMGPLDPRNTVEAGLRKGKHFAFVGSTDHHAGFPGSYGDGIAAVWAEEKTREGIWNALLKGHSYAATGDRIQCQFHLNDAMMGDMVDAASRTLRFTAQGESPIESMSIRRNGKLVCGKLCSHKALQNDKRYLLRMEMGWSSSPDKYHWEGRLSLQNGKILRVQPYLRGKNALSPSDKMHGAAQPNDLNNGFEQRETEASFWCDTFCNVSTLHPMTDAFVFEVEADVNAVIRLEIGGDTHEAPLNDLLVSGFTGHVKPWHSHAWKLHTAYPASACEDTLEFQDVPENPLDVYQAEVLQINGHRAFCSPIFVRS